MNREWEKEYESLLNESRKKGEVDSRAEASEKRLAPRFRLASGSIWIKLDLSFDVIDVSVSGISFYSSQPFEKNQVFAITLSKAFRIEAEILDCDLVETDPHMMEAQYLVRCRFVDEASAMRFLVMLKEMNDPTFEFST